MKGWMREGVDVGVCVCGEREPGELTLLLTRAQCGPHSSLIAAKNPKVAL